MTFVGDGNEIYVEHYDESGDVYGCEDAKKDFVRCDVCTWRRCPMRGENNYDKRNTPSD